MLPQLLAPTKNQRVVHPVVEPESVSQFVAAFSTKIALQIHSQPEDDQLTLPPDHKVGTAPDVAAHDVLIDLQSSIVYVPLST